MDTRTAATLCMIDLEPILESGDFRQIHVTQTIIEEALISASGDRNQAMLLHRIGKQLDRLTAYDAPEADALCRAVKATVRHRLAVRFRRRRAMLDLKQKKRYA